MRRSLLVLVAATLCAALPSAAQDRMVTLNPSGAAPGATVDITISVPFTANWGTVRFSPADGMTVTNLRAAADGSGQTQFTLQIGSNVKPGKYAFIYEPRARRLPAAMSAPLPYRGEFAVSKDLRSQRMPQLQARTGRTTTARGETPQSTLGQRNAGATRAGSQARDMMRIKWPSQEIFNTLTAPHRKIYQQMFSAAIPKQTELYVWNGRCRPGTDCFGCAEGPIFVDWNRLDVDWWFQAKITDIRAASAEWQISWFPFPIGKNLADPPGLLATGKLEKIIIDKDFWFQIDLTNYAPYPRGKRPSGGPLQAAPTGTAKKAAAQRVVRGSTATAGRDRGPAVRADFRSNLVFKTAGSRMTKFGRFFPGARVVRNMPLPLRNTFHIRLILRDAQGAPVGMASRVVELEFGEPEAEEPFHFSPQGLGHPAVSFVRYEPVRPYAPDCLCWVQTLDDIKIMGRTAFPAGTLINTCAPKDESLLDEVGDVVGGFFGAIGDLVSYVAEIYNAAKSAVINAVVSALKATGIGCGQECQFLVTSAIDYGLTVCGMPPTLPSFRELTMMGTDYLAAQIAAEAGIPPDAAQEAARAFVNEVAFSKGSGSGGFRTIPDPNRQYRPAVVLLHVSAPPSGEGSLLIVRDRSGLYKDAEIPVPALAGFQDYDIPVALQPVEKPDAWMGLLPRPEDGVNIGVYFDKQLQAQNALAAWTQKYTSGGFELEIVTKANTGYWPHMRIRCSSNSTQADAQAWK
jgi:hypothetical protein